MLSMWGPFGVNPITCMLIPHPHRLSREEKGREGKRCEEMRGREEKRREEKRREEK